MRKFFGIGSNPFRSGERGEFLPAAAHESHGSKQQADIIAQQEVHSSTCICC